MTLVLILYCFAVALLMVYGINCHMMTYLFKLRLFRHRESNRRLLTQFFSEGNNRDLPMVTSQLPI